MTIVLLVVVTNSILYQRRLEMSVAFDPCTYRQLEQAFRNRTQYTTLPSSRNSSVSEQQCWRLQDEVLRVPVDAITNRDSLRKLGGGAYGSVSKAVVRLNEKEQCIVAVKTDQCFQAWTNPFKKGRVSCISPYAYNIRRTSLGAEYTGALVFAASQKVSLDDDTLSGFLPTWGVLQDRHPTPSWTIFPGESSMYNTHVTDPLVKGVIMPLRKFEDFRELTTDERTGIATDAGAVAKIMLPAAKALEFISGLGAAFGDICDKNIGLVSPKNGPPYAMLYDNSKFTLEGEGSNNCTLEGQLKEACNFCMEESFPRSHEAIRNNDARRFRGQIKDLLEYNQDPESGRELKVALDKCGTIHDVVETLQDFAQGNE